MFFERVNGVVAHESDVFIHSQSTVPWLAPSKCAVLKKSELNVKVAQSKTGRYVRINTADSGARSF